MNERETIAHEAFRARSDFMRIDATGAQIADWIRRNDYRGACWRGYPKSDMAEDYASWLVSGDESYRITVPPYDKLVAHFGHRNNQ
jgi:hypothetical protein